ncbi:MAG: anti-sigma factor family protein [Limisphaerales bacterium]
MNCADFEERILDYLDHALPAADRHLVETHVATCAACRRWWDEQQQLDARLAAALRRPTLSADFKQRVLRRVETAVALDTPRLREQMRTMLESEYAAKRLALRKSLFNLPNLLDMVAGAVVAAVGGVLLYHLAGNLQAASLNSPAAVFENPLILTSLAGGALALFWGLKIGARSAAARWVDWL